MKTNDERELTLGDRVEIPIEAVLPGYKTEPGPRGIYEVAGVGSRVIVPYEQWKERRYGKNG